MATISTLDRVRRELGVRYVAVIGVQRAGERVRVSAQLIDADRRSLRWAERYDRQAQDIFAVQDEVAEQIAAVLVAHVARAERERIARKPIETLQAYDYYLRALDQSRMWDSSDASSAEAMLEKAIELAPGFAAAQPRCRTISSAAGWNRRMPGGALPRRSSGPGRRPAPRCSTIRIFPPHTPPLAGFNCGNIELDEAV